MIQGAQSRPFINPMAAIPLTMALQNTNQARWFA